jgi:hypothetical protein
MNKDILVLCRSLFKEAQDYRVSISKLARIKRTMEGGKDNDLCKLIPLLLREIEIRIRRNVREKQKKDEALTSLNIRRSQFLVIKEEAAYRKGK